MGLRPQRANDQHLHLTQPWAIGINKMMDKSIQWPPCHPKLLTDVWSWVPSLHPFSCVTGIAVSLLLTHLSVPTLVCPLSCAVLAHPRTPTRLPALAHSNPHPRQIFLRSAPTARYGARQARPTSQGKGLCSWCSLTPPPDLQALRAAQTPLAEPSFFLQNSSARRLLALCAGAGATTP